MAEEQKSTFPWIQLIATVGTIIAALIGITPYLLKLNAPAAPQTPTIVILTLPPAATTPAPVTTLPATPVETATVTTQTTLVTTTVPTTGPPPTGNETPVPTTEPATPATTAATTPMTTAGTPAPTVTTLPPGPAIQMAVNATSVPRGGFILASGSTDPAVPQVSITLKNSTTFQSEAVPVALSQGLFQFQIDTSAYDPGDYTIYAAVPDTQAIASASFVITP